MLTLEDLKADLGIVHDDDDEILQLLLDSAEDEALQFLGLTALPSGASINRALLCLVRAGRDYDRPDDMLAMRRVAESLLQPYRYGIGP